MAISISTVNTLCGKEVTENKSYQNVCLKKDFICADSLALYA